MVKKYFELLSLSQFEHLQESLNKSQFGIVLWDIVTYPIASYQW